MTLTLRQTAALLATLLVISLSLIVLDGRNQLDGAKGLLGGVVAPVGESLSNLGGGFSGSRQVGDAELIAENERLREENDRLLADNAQLRTLEPRVEQLEAQLEFQQARPELVEITAGVVGRDPQSREKFLIIDRGSADGVAVGQPVVSPHFLVGQVIEVDPNRAKVLLVVDSAFQTGVQLQSSGDRGVIYGRWQAGGRMVMRHIAPEAEIMENDLVITSGMTSGIPAGLIVGQIIDEGVERDELRNEVQADVVPAVNFDALQSVTVIIGTQTE